MHWIPVFTGMTREGETAARSPGSEYGMGMEYNVFVLINDYRNDG